VFATHAYDSHADLAHPLEVARLVESTRSADELVAAAVLHDVLEDTDVDPRLLAGRFGARVATLVFTLTEDASIRGYSARKAELRNRVCAAGPDAGLIFIADKLSNVRCIRRGEKQYRDRKLAHYEATLELFRREQPQLPLLDQLARDLAGLRGRTMAVQAR
jgi:(p)ppGpp synthase/HD superfamily hydrolase